jgi:hypothetical protein
LAFFVLAGNHYEEIPISVTNGISLPRSHIDRGIQLEFQRLAHFWFAEKRQEVRVRPALSLLQCIASEHHPMKRRFVFRHVSLVA